MPCCEISDCAQMSKTVIAVRHFELGGRESLETAATHVACTKSSASQKSIKHIKIVLGECNKYVIVHTFSIISSRSSLGNIFGTSPLFSIIFISSRNNSSYIWEYIKLIKLKERHATTLIVYRNEIKMPRAWGSYERNTMHKIYSFKVRNTDFWAAHAHTTSSWIYCCPN